jgi:hypothetical protein
MENQERESHARPTFRHLRSRNRLSRQCTHVVTGKFCDFVKRLSSKTPSSVCITTEEILLTTNSWIVGYLEVI